MPRGGRRSTTWTSENNFRKPKGTIHKKTKVKAAVGLKNWDQLEQFIKTTGAEKWITEIKKLKGKDFTVAYTAAAEFVKPKLSRTEYRPTGPKIQEINFDELPLEIRKKILEHLRKKSA